ncbi:hypothetical protein A5906_14035 [Bradyrhizobium sacchari]|uniref:hypothetical protein n=1 Tax=Bradyrhizobium sacchari TaxID=1399419 RepID=UPI0009D50414|nr:hypothetical protein [Bradyrhizobium sacchari]OPY94432.1 hypothetical protein A5906_14035 [Bradyrhizobium sacchari]
MAPALKSELPPDFEQRCSATLAQLEGKDTELLDLFLFSALLHLTSKDAAELVLLDGPAARPVSSISIVRPSAGCLSGGMAVKMERVENECVPLADMGRKPDDVRDALMRHSGDNRNRSSCSAFISRRTSSGCRS